jgi:protein involved in polysaccharide export with SLBB domain
MTLTDAVNSAGGLSVFAGRSEIHVFHKDRSLAGIYDYDAILKYKTEDPILASGDYIFVGGSLD